MSVARKGQAPLSEIAKDFGISDSCLRNCGRADSSATTDRSFSRHRPRAGRMYPESHAAAEDQPLSQPRASRHPLQMYPLVCKQAVDGIPVAVTCRVLLGGRRVTVADCPVGTVRSGGAALTIIRLVTRCLSETPCADNLPVTKLARGHL